jgi:hypothetical protein
MLYHNFYFPVISLRQSLASDIYIAAVAMTPVTVAERYKAWTVFARSEAGIVGSMFSVCGCVCVCVRFSVFVCRQRGLATS